MKFANINENYDISNLKQIRTDLLGSLSELRSDVDLKQSGESFFNLGRFYYIHMYDEKLSALNHCKQ